MAISYDDYLKMERKPQRNIITYDDYIKKYNMFEKEPEKPKEEQKKVGLGTKIFGTAGKISTDLGSGFLELIEGATDLAQYGLSDASKAIGLKGLSEFLKRNADMDVTKLLTGKAKEYYEPKAAKPFQEGQIGESVSKTTGNIMAYLGTAGALKMAGVPTAVKLGKVALDPTVTATGAILGTSEGYGQALESGSSKKEALKYGLAKGTTRATLDTAIGGVMGVGGAGVVDKAVLSGITKTKVSDEIGKVMIETGPKSVLPYVKTWLAKSGIEGGKAVIRNALDQEYKKMTYDKNAQKYFQNKDGKLDLTKAGQDFLVYSTLSALFQLPNLSSEIKMSKTIQKDYMRGLTKWADEKGVEWKPTEGGDGIYVKKPNVSPYDFMKKDIPQIESSLLPTKQDTQNSIVKVNETKLPAIKDTYKIESSQHPLLPANISQEVPKVESAKIAPIDIKKQVEKAKTEGKFSPDTVKEIRNNPELVSDFIATRQLKSGKITPAIRNSGVYAPKEFETHEFKDIGGVLGGKSYNFLAAAGAFDNVTPEQAAKTGWGPMKNLQFSIDKQVGERYVYINDKVSSLNSIAKKHNVPINEKTGEELFNALENRATSQVYDKLAKDVRTVLDKLRDEANEVRLSLGKPEIKYRKDYISHMQKTNFWDRMLGDKRTVVSDNFDFIIPNEKANPHARTRTGERYEEKNAWKILERYINAISNDIYLSPSIEQVKAVNSVIMTNYPKMSNYLNRFVKENLVGQSAQLDSFFGFYSGTKRKAIAGKIIHARNTYALSGNFVWSVLTQPASITNTFAQTGGITRGTQNTIGGMKDYLTNKKIKEKIDNLPVMKIKSEGKTVGKTVGGDVDKIVTKLNKTKLDSYNEFLAIFPDAMENFLTGASCAAGYREATKLGLTGKDADMFADMVGQNTQSIYNREGRTLMLNNILFRLAMPFKTFAFEQYRYAKRLFGSGGGVPLEKKQRLSQAIMLLAGTTLYGMYSKKVANKTLNTVSTYLPVAGDLIDEKISEFKQTAGLEERVFQGSGRSPVAPLQDVNDIRRALDTLINHGNWQPLRKELINWSTGFAGVGGASTLNRFIDGYIASAQGYQKTRAGKVAFPVEGTKAKVKSMILGPYTTKKGQEYIERGFKPLGDKQYAEAQKNIKEKGTTLTEEFDKVMKNRDINKLYEELKISINTNKGIKEIKDQLNKKEKGLGDFLEHKYKLTQIPTDKKSKRETGTRKKEVIEYLLKQNLKEDELIKLYNGAGYNKDFQQIKNANIPIKLYLKLHKNIATFKTKEDEKTNVGSKGSVNAKREKVFNEIQKLHTTRINKLILYGMEGYSLTSAEKTEVFNHINSLQLTKKQKEDIARTIKSFEWTKTGQLGRW